MSQSVQYRPQGYSTATPWIISRDTSGLLDFLKSAFDAEELARLVNPDGKIGHAEACIGDAIIMGFDSPDGWPPTPAFLRLFVPDADQIQAKALAAGAIEITKVTALAFGDKVGRVCDPFGNVWWLQTHIEDVPPDEFEKRWTDPDWASAMGYVEHTLKRARPES